MAAMSGQHNGTTIIDPGALRQSRVVEIKDNIDLVLGGRLPRARGFILNCEDCYFGPNESSFGHSGTGGSIGFADPDSGIGFAYVMNQLQSHRPPRSRLLIDAFYDCI